MEATEIEVPARAEGEALDTVVSCQAPAGRPGTQLPRRLRQITEPVRELLHLPFGNEGVVGGSERWWQRAAREEGGGIDGNVHRERRAVTVGARARDLLACLACVTRRARDRVLGSRSHGWAAGTRRRGIAAHLVFIVDALIAHRHLQERSGGRDRVHRDQAGQPPASGPQAVIDREKSYFNADRLDEAGDVFVVFIAEILLEIERPGRTDQRPHHPVRILVDPERSRHEAEVEAARNDAQLAQSDGAAVRKHDDARIAGREAIVGFTAGCERVTDVDIAMSCGVLRAVPPCARPPDRQAVICRIEGVIPGIALQVFGQRGFGHGCRHRLPRADDGDLRHAIAPPIDEQRDLAAVQHAIAPEGADPDTDALTHSRPIRSDGSVRRLPARARRRDEATRGRIEIGGAISGGHLDCEDGGNEEREAHVGLCTDPGEG